MIGREVLTIEWEWGRRMVYVKPAQNFSEFEYAIGLAPARYPVPMVADDIASVPLFWTVTLMRYHTWEFQDLIDFGIIPID